MDKIYIGISLPKNINGSVYTVESYRNAMTKFNMRVTKQPVPGQLGHSDDTFMFKNISHLVKGVWMKASNMPRKIKKARKKNGTYQDYKFIMAKVTLLDTVNGANVKKIHREFKDMKKLSTIFTIEPQMFGIVDKNGHVAINEILSYNLVPKPSTKAKPQTT